MFKNLKEEMVKFGKYGNADSLKAADWTDIDATAMTDFGAATWDDAKKVCSVAGSV